MKSYKDLAVYTMSFDLAVKVHQLTFKLPKYEMYELEEVKTLMKEYDILGAKLYTFITYVENNWKS